MPWLINTDYKVIRSHNYKYIHWVQHPDKNELYDISKDSLEMNNLFYKEEHQILINKLKIDLVNLMGKANGVY